MLHIDGSHHQWFGDERWHDLIVILDDATSEIYYAQLAEAESTVTIMAAISRLSRKKVCSAASIRTVRHTSSAHRKPESRSTGRHSPRSDGRSANCRSVSSRRIRRRHGAAAREAFGHGRDDCLKKSGSGG